MARALIVVRLAIACACACVLVTASHARADVDPTQAIEQSLARGQKLYDDQEYAGAIKALAPVTRDARATRAQRLRALELIALAELIRGDRGAARATFERILDIDPGYQLRDTSGSPKIREFFDDMKKQLVPGYDPNAGADLEHAAPTAGTAGKPIEVEVRVTRGNVSDLILGTRRRGELSYRVTPLLPRGGARWHVRVVPDASAKPYILEYYVEARDAAGAAIARIAGPDQPLEIALSAGGIATTTTRVVSTTPWFARWYVIAGAAVVAAGVTGAAIESSRGPGPGTLPPGSITLH